MTGKCHPIGRPPANPGLPALERKLTRRGHSDDLQCHPRNGSLPRVRPAANSYRLVDWVTQGYLLLVALVALASHRGPWLILVGGHVAALLGVHLLACSHPSSASSRRWRWLRDIYPLLLLFGLYSETLVINRMLGLPRIDPWLIAADERLFGCQPAEAMMAAFSQPWFSELMHLSYLSFYLMVGVLGFWLLLRNRPAFGHFVTVVACAFYACYGTYLFVPAVGPRILYQDSPERSDFTLRHGHAPRSVPATVETGPCYRLLEVIEQHAEIAGAAFPSSHVALGLITAWFSWRYVRPVRWLHLVLALSICLSTVYTRAHYGVDVLAGLVTAGLLFGATQWAYRRWGWRE